MYAQMGDDSVLTSETMGRPGGHEGSGQEEMGLWILGRI